MNRLSEIAIRNSLCCALEFQKVPLLKLVITVSVREEEEEVGDNLLLETFPVLIGRPYKTGERVEK